MKKILIILGIIILLVVAGILFVNFNQSEEEELGSSLNDNQLAGEESAIKPWKITVGLYDPATEPDKLTKLLDSRLKEIGFKTAILKELVDPAAAESEKTTLLFRPENKEKLEVFARETIATAVYRRGENSVIAEDLIVASWNLEDFDWGSFSQLANEYNNPLPAVVSVLVLNAGAESGSAGEVVDLLKASGYSQAQAQNAETPASQSMIYYQRNYKNAAKTLQKLLAENGYPDISYRSQLTQAANLLIILGQSATTTEAPPTP